MIKLQLTAEIDTSLPSEARTRLDAFREAVQPSAEYGITLYETAPYISAEEELKSEPRYMIRRPINDSEFADTYHYWNSLSKQWGGYPHATIFSQKDRTHSGDRPMGGEWLLLAKGTVPTKPSARQLGEAIEDMLTTAKELGFDTWPGDSGAEFSAACERARALIDIDPTEAITANEDGTRSVEVGGQQIAELPVELERIPVPTNHTPTPWACDYYLPAGSADGQWQIINLDSDNGDVIAIVDPDDICTDLDLSAEANAAFIVRAVNSHEALVSALREALDYIGCNSGGAVQDQMRAALKLAKGGQV